MLSSTYRAYGENDKTIKTGTVNYEPDNDPDQQVMNFCSAVAADVGEELFDLEVAGITD